MTHLMQFSVDLDDESIRKQVISNTAVMVEKAMFDGGRYVEHDYYGVKMSSTMKNIVEKKVDEFLKARSGEIIDAASKHLAEKLARTKKAKQILTDMANAEANK